MKTLKLFCAAAAAVWSTGVVGMTVNGTNVSGGGNLSTMGWAYASGVIKVAWEGPFGEFGYVIDSQDGVSISRLGVGVHGGLTYQSTAFCVSIRNGIFTESFGMNRLDSNIFARVALKISGGDFRCAYDPFIGVPSQPSDYHPIDPYCYFVRGFIAGENADVEITGGDFSFDPSAYVPAGVAVTPVGGRWHVGRTTVVRLFEEDDDTPPEGNTTYNGWVRDESGSLKGTITIKTGKPNDDGVFKPTVRWTPIEGPKKPVTIPKGDYPTVDDPVLEIPGVGDVRIGGESVVGINVDIQAAADFSKNKVRKVDYNTRLASKAGSWTFAFVTDQGPATFAVTVSKKGKGKLTGFLPDGTKVSASAQGVLGDSALAIPFALGKKAPCGFVFWVMDDGTADVSDFSRLRTAKLAFEIAETVGPAALRTPAAATYPFALDETAVRASVPDAIDETFLPLTVAFNGKKFDAGKAAKVSYKGGVLAVDTSKGKNVTGLKLSYSKGVLKGSFTVYAVTSGKLVKNKFTVAGVLIDGVGYAAGTNKKLSAIPLVLTR